MCFVSGYHWAVLLIFLQRSQMGNSSAGSETRVAAARPTATLALKVRQTGPAVPLRSLGIRAQGRRGGARKSGLWISRIGTRPPPLRNEYLGKIKRERFPAASIKNYSASLPRLFVGPQRAILCVRMHPALRLGRAYTEDCWWRIVVGWDARTGCPIERSVRSLHQISPAG